MKSGQTFTGGIIKMDAFNKALNSVNGSCKPIIALALNLALLFLVVGVVFPTEYNIITNVTGLVDTFISGGLAGLITLMVFISLTDR
jgi:hypothetical protein